MSRRAPDAWPILVPVAVLLGVGHGLCLAAGLTTVARLASPTERDALSGTFYACAYLGFGVPLVLALAGGNAVGPAVAGPVAAHRGGGGRPGPARGPPADHPGAGGRRSNVFRRSSPVPLPGPYTA